MSRNSWDDDIYSTGKAIPEQLGRELSHLLFDLNDKILARKATTIEVEEYRQWVIANVWWTFGELTARKEIVKDGAK